MQELNGLLVLAKIDGRWYHGKITDDKIKIIKPVEGALKNTKDGFVTLHHYIWEHSISHHHDSILAAYKAQRLYLQNARSQQQASGEPAGKEDSTWDAYWWKHLNRICLTCFGSCKQSSRVQVCYCAKYCKTEK